MRIDPSGDRTTERFDDTFLCLHEYYSFPSWTSPVSPPKKFDGDSYLEEVVHDGLSRGVPESVYLASRGQRDVWKNKN